ncbi:hypothetical protein F5879DRAFT_924403 [Lentinula edodes]|nr:hypothetical protein F5879DRAFT_924403 [Lentinula edodes]
MQLQLWARNIAPGSSIEVVPSRPLYLTNVSLSCDFQNAFAPTSLVLSIVRTDRRTSPPFTVVTLIVGQSLTQHIHVRLDASIKYILSVKGLNIIREDQFVLSDTLILPNMESANQNSNDLGATHATPAITISPPITNRTRQPPSSSESTNPTVSNVATSSLPSMATGPSDAGLTGDGCIRTCFDNAPSTGSDYLSGQYSTELNSSSATVTGFGYASLVLNCSSLAYTNLPVQAPRPVPYESAMGSNNGDRAVKKMKIEDGTARRQYLPTGTGISGQMGGSYTGSDRSNAPEVTNPKKRKSTANNDAGASPLALPPYLNMSASSSSADRAQSSSPHPPPAAHSRQNFLKTLGTNNSHLNMAPQAGPSNYHMAPGTSAGYSSRNPFVSPSAGK